MHIRSPLFEPILIGRVEVKNRIVMSPLSPNLAAPDGLVTNGLAKFYEARAKGGVGLIITGWSFIGGEASRDAGIQIGAHDDRFLPSLNTLTETIHNWETKIFLQLSYVGRRLKASRIADNSIAGLPGQAWIAEGFYSPRDLSVEEIDRVAELFGKSAQRAKIAGFDGVEVGATPGELLNSFMLEDVNKREDEYGGELEFRMRFPLEVAARIRRYVGKDFAVGFRYSGEEDPHYFNGKTIGTPEAARIGAMFEEAGVDYLNIFRAMVPVYVLERIFKTAESVKRRVGIPVVATGSITRFEVAENIISSGRADLVALGRAVIADPEWANKAHKGRPEDIIFCIRCNECIFRVSRFRVLRCAVNVEAGQEAELKPLLPVRHKKRIAVIGGGPAGINASITAAKRGHEVTLFEKKNILGGNLVPGSIPDFKSDFRYLLQRLNRELEESSVKIITGREMKLENFEAQRFDAVVVATGAKPKRSSVRWEDGSRVFSPYDALCSPDKIAGKRVVVVGGGATGCEVALFHARRGREVEVVEVEEDILMEEQPEFNKIELKQMLKEADVRIRTHAEIERIEEDAVEILGRDGERLSLPADSVIISIGFEPDRSLYNQLRTVLEELYAIGDCESVGRICHAIHQGHAVGSSI